MIRSFKCKDIAALFTSGSGVRFKAIEKVAFRKLDYLNAAATLHDLRLPGGNRLEALRGNRLGQHSIRINDQFRLCFVWRENEALDVEIVDYHR